MSISNYRLKFNLCFYMGPMDKRHNIFSYRDQRTGKEVDSPNGKWQSSVLWVVGGTLSI